MTTPERDRVRLKERDARHVHDWALKRKFGATINDEGDRWTVVLTDGEKEVETVRYWDQFWDLVRRVATDEARW